MMRPTTLADLRRIAVATALALLVWGALAGIEGHSAPPAGGAAAAPQPASAAQDGAAGGKPPVGPVIATAPANHAASVGSVLGKTVDTTDTEALRDAILTPLLDQYAEERGIKAEPAEIDALLGKMRRDMAASGLATEEDLTPEETAEVDAMQREMARSIIRQWKINKALHEQYGGRIIYQQLGPEPLDAYRQLLRLREADGAFAFRDQAIEKSFWRYFTDDSIHDFMAPGGANEARAFTTPPWEQQP
jgi:hypothetical protein